VLCLVLRYSMGTPHTMVAFVVTLMLTAQKGDHHKKARESCWVRTRGKVEMVIIQGLRRMRLSLEKLCASRQRVRGAVGPWVARAPDASDPGQNVCVEPRTPLLDWNQDWNIR